MGLAALVEDAIVEIEVEIGEGLKPAALRGPVMRIRLPVCIDNYFGELRFDGRWFCAGYKTDEKLIGRIGTMPITKAPRFELAGIIGRAEMNVPK